MTTRKIRWGILGTGHIAHLFVQDLRLIPDAKVLAVGSRTRERAEAFGAEFDIPHRHAGYEGLAGDAEVDIVYVATPNALHREHMLMCLEAGRAVLCEKPFTLNAAEAEEVLTVARARSRFVMEGMWTRCFPAWRQVREWLADGKIGEARLVKADVCLRRPFDPARRNYDLNLGGGALLDLGVYPLALAQMVFGAEPAGVTGCAAIGVTGVDEQSGYLLRYAGGQMALLGASLQAEAGQQAEIAGTLGRIIVPHPWTRPERAELFRQGDEGRTFESPRVGRGFVYEAQEAMLRLRGGECESPWMSWTDTLQVTRTADALRRSWGLRYPGEAEAG